MAKYLVTGGAGFLGGYIVEELLRRGEQVRILDNFSIARRESVRHLLKSVEVFEGDVRNYHNVREAVQGTGIIIHLAALSSVAGSLRDPLTMNDVNVTGTLNLLHAGKEEHVERLVFASSASVYGDTNENPKHEDLAPRPQNPFAVSKLAGEHYCQVFARAYGIQTIALRYFAVYGPGQDPKAPDAGAIPRFIRSILKGRPPRVEGDGRQTRDFIYISDAVDATLRAATYECGFPAVLNCSTNNETSLNDVIALINRTYKSHCEPRYEAARGGDIRRLAGSYQKIGSILGFKPAVPLEEGLKKTCQYYFDQASARLVESVPLQAQSKVSPYR